jgi:competence protein ComEA
MSPKGVTTALCAVLLALATTSVPRVYAAREQGGQDLKPTQVNLNTAGVTELEKLPGVGPAMAQRILEYRQKNGGFKKIEDLMNVRGIGEASFLKLKPQITVTQARVAER